MSTPADASATPSATLGAGALGVIAFRGPDAARFLQGQLSADVESLGPGARTFAGLHNPQGRVIALLDLRRHSAEEIVAVLPAEILAAVIARLGKYVLRAKVKIAEATAEYPELVAASAGQELAQVRAGVPQVYAATSESFVAQMLNLDLLGAIAFDKGCYTGQEVIARAHYRGRVKRRLQRWLNDSGTPLKPGDSARAMDGRALSVVRVAALEDGAPGPMRQEILAVGNFAASTEPESGGDAAGGEAAGSVAVSGPLPLPYSLPE
jgi:tRNA-modifying protein YgfZ